MSSLAHTGTCGRVAWPGSHWTCSLIDFYALDEKGSVELVFDL
jgi:hypothetical protein